MNKNRENLRDRYEVGDQFLLICVFSLLLLVPTFFYRKTLLVFSVPQFTILWVFGSLILFLGLFKVFFVGHFRKEPRLLSISILLFAFALLITSALSSQTWLAFTGAISRGAGAISYLLCLAIFIMVFQLGRRRSLEPIVLAFVISHIAVAGYAVIQAYGQDPFDWGTEETMNTGHSVFSTLGNANFSAGYIGLTFPILIWFIFLSKYRPLYKCLSGGCIGLSLIALSYFASIQGNITAIIGVFVLFRWAFTRTPKGRPFAVIIAFLLGATIAVFPLAVVSPNVSFLLFIVLFALVNTYVGVLINRKHTAKDEESNEKIVIKRSWYFVSLVFLAVGFILAKSKIFSEIKDGLDQRIDFWKTSFSIFKSNPFFGTGLETFGNHFTLHRPKSHAVEMATLLSDSPHSVILGFLSGGGILLFVTYLLLVSTITYYGIEAVKKNSGSKKLYYESLLLAFFACLLQSSVSIDIPGLMVAHWVLGGLLVAGGHNKELGKFFLFHDNKNKVSFRRNLFLVLIAVLFIFSLNFLVKPLRANIEGYKADLALVENDVQEMIQHFQKAKDLQPENWYYADRLAHGYKAAGNIENALLERERAAELAIGNPFAAIAAARDFESIGDLGGAGYWYEKAVSYDNNSAGVLTEAAVFFVQNGKEKRAEELLERFVTLGSRNMLSWQWTSEIYAFLGDVEKSEKAAYCKTSEDRNCWTKF